MTEIPRPFLDRMQRLLGDEFDAFAESLSASSLAGLRVNTLKINPGAFRELAVFNLTPVPWSPAGFIVPAEEQPGKHPYHAAGLYYLQEPSAMAVVELLDPQPGERVLDLAAAPGGKTTHIASLMNNEGLLVANEIHPRRAWELAENMERWGIHNTVILNETPRRLADYFGDFFDRVLVDAPCSGEGMFRRSQIARSEWTLGLPQSCSTRQSTILDDAARLVRPAGRLAYTTCTFAPQENEGVIYRFLDDHPEFSLLKIPLRYGFSPAMPDWIENGAGLPELERAIRLWPHRVPGEGHFIALMQRDDQQGNTPQKYLLPHKSRVTAPVRRLIEDFWHTTLLTDLGFENLLIEGTYLYQTPRGSPDLKGLKVIHPGWWLGILRKKAFEPSHALAMGLEVRDARQRLNLTLHSPGISETDQVMAYLRGENLHSPGEEGWVIVAVDGYPLGWGKRVNNVVKNRYPRGLRWIYNLS